MTDTPLHRAARALMKSQSGVDDLDALDDEMQKGLLDDVRARIRALMENVTARIAAGPNVEKNGDDAEQIRLVEIALSKDAVMAAMLDAALSE